MITNKEELKTAVREQYGAIARNGGSCSTTCCGPASNASRLLGYSESELTSVPEGADLGLGCGNPQAIAALRPGEVVLDLGSGAGFDCFLAAQQVGPTGRVIGVDMTTEMLAKARLNAHKAEASNVEFRLGEIEHLPVSDGSVDVILSNCVINLSPDKQAAFREAFRVLKTGGRLAISDVVRTARLPEALRNDPSALTGCASGAATPEELEELLTTAGFVDVKIAVRTESREFIKDWLPGSDVEVYIASATIEAVKPAAGCCAPSCCSPGARA